MFTIRTNPQKYVYTSASRNIHSYRRHELRCKP